VTNPVGTVTLRNLSAEDPIGLQEIGSNKQYIGSLNLPMWRGLSIFFALNAKSSHASSVTAYDAANASTLISFENEIALAAQTRSARR
jgi:hypothetical protein